MQRFRKRSRRAFGAAALAGAAALSFAAAGTAAAAPSSHRAWHPGPPPHQDWGAGAVYTTTNSPTGNSVDVYLQRHGVLVRGGSYATGGLGTGSGLGQGAVTLSQDGSTLLAVDAGSDQVSDFAVGQDGTLRLRDVVNSEGTTPTSVAVRGGLVEVLNAGGSPNVAGFALTWSGLVPIAGGVADLSTGASGPKDVTISPNGAQVAVTEKLSDTIDTFSVGSGGVLRPPVGSPSDSPLSFSSVFAPDGRLLVADDGSSGTSAVSNYSLSGSGALTATEAAVPNSQTASCWIAIGAGGDLFVDNAGSGTVSSYQLLDNGRLAFFGNTTVAAGAVPLDNAVSPDGHTLYVLDAGNNQVHAFAIGADGQLGSINEASVPAGSSGLAVGW